MGEKCSEKGYANTRLQKQITVDYIACIEYKAVHTEIHAIRVFVKCFRDRVC